MDLTERIKRRQRRNNNYSLIRDYKPLSPVTHIAEPSDRGPVFEQLLDHLDPVFDGRLPPNAYVHGPVGSGKSATVTALFTRLEQLSIETRSAIHTSTRVTSTTFPTFVYVDLRKVSTVFSFYRTVLNALTEELIPEHGSARPKSGTDSMSVSKRRDQASSLRSIILAN